MLSSSKQVSGGRRVLPRSTPRIRHRIGYWRPWGTPGARHPPQQNFHTLLWSYLAGIRQSGFSLLGVMIATAALVLVATSVVALGLRSAAASRLTKDREVATFLAREAVELVRSLRDDNWIAFADAAGNSRCVVEPCLMKWRGDPFGTPEEQERAICNGVSKLDPENRKLQNTSANAVDDNRLNRDGTRYTHEAVGEPTSFHRWVEIAVVNYAQDVGTGTDDCGESYDIAVDAPLRPHGFRVTATVSWTGRDGAPVAVTVGEELHPWLRYR